jgi:hypothetical protein
MPGRSWALTSRFQLPRQCNEKDLEAVDHDRAMTPPPPAAPKTYRYRPWVPLRMSAPPADFRLRSSKVPCERCRLLQHVWHGPAASARHQIEPTSSLDFGNQIRVLEHVGDLANRSGLAVIMATHDPNRALLYASQVAAIGRNGSFAVGLPGDMVTEIYLRDTYDLHVRLVDTVLSGGRVARMCLPIGSARAGGRS